MQFSDVKMTHACQDAIMLDILNGYLERGTATIAKTRAKRIAAASDAQVAFLQYPFRQIMVAAKRRAKESPSQLQGRVSFGELAPNA